MSKSLSKIIKLIFTLLIIIIFAYIGVFLVTLAYEFGYRIFTESAVEEAPGRDVLVQIKDDMSDFDIGDEFAEKGLVRDSWLFAMQIKLSAYQGKLESGVYTLNTSMTPKEMIVAIVQENEEAKKVQSSTESATESSAESLEGTGSGDEEGTAPVEEQ